ncbi:hypothetical protein [Chondrinema litorale]|uniref:hypothetical protein n=1 Tax=Chondrinema litorale TaxID=2994555 RepID=UPI002543E215|nr:hypothetical protein [Chondrinema litorale]UZR99039.1 hypothetical protein OQ292_34135 [Chondrinema litorale]
MKSIYESSFISIKYDEKINLLEATWLENTKNMNESQFKSEFLSYVSFANECAYKKVLINETQFHFNRELHIQQWVSSMVHIKLLKKYENAKMAIVYRNEEIQQITVKKMVKEMQLSDITTLYFESKQDAQSWLLEGSIIPSNRKVFLFLNNEFADYSDQVEKKIVSI